MTPVARAYFFQGLKDDLTARNVLDPIARRLKTGNASATIDRLFESKHVYDLRLIAAIALILVVWIFVIAVAIASCAIYLNLEAQTDSIGPHVIAHAVIAGAPAFLTLFGPTFAVFYAVLTWVYQAANTRLGVVDLFACEIDTICRVITVTDMVQDLIKQQSHDRMDELASSRPARSTGHPFNSQESYFPILDSSVGELQKLEARVVSHITAFYTFIKAVRDSLRGIAEIQPVQTRLRPGHEPSFHAAELVSQRQEAFRNLLYTLYLGLESGRKAIADLVEFEPDYSERTIVILISELTAYRFLREQFTAAGEMRHDRLGLRQPDYGAIVPALCRQVEEHKRLLPVEPFDPRESKADDARQWCGAYELLHELKARYAGVSRLPIEHVSFIGAAARG